MNKLKIFFAAFISLSFYYVIFALFSAITNPLEWGVYWQIMYVGLVIITYILVRKSE